MELVYYKGGSSHRWKGRATYGKARENRKTEKEGNNGEKEKRKEKESGKKKRENMTEIEACINRLSFSSLFSKPTFWNPKSSNK